MAAAVLLAGCTASQDRGGGFDFNSYEDHFDAVEDADEVILVRNANEFPNFVQVCHNGAAYVTGKTLHGLSIIPDPQRTAYCQFTRGENGGEG